MRTLTKLLAGCAFPVALAAQTADLTGAGAMFPFPIYSKWFSGCVELAYARQNKLPFASSDARQSAWLEQPPLDSRTRPRPATV
jgi:hypothetical protein